MKGFASDRPVKLVFKDDEEDLLVVAGVTEITVGTESMGQSLLRPTITVNGTTIATFDPDIRDQMFEGYWVIPAGFITGIWPDAGLTVDYVAPGIDIEDEMGFEGWSIR